MKRLITLFFLFLFGLINAQETIHFSTDAPQGLSVRNSTSTGLSLHYSIQELGIANIDNGEAKGQEIILKGQFAPNGEGRPNLPVVSRFIAIPQGSTVSLQYKENARTVLQNIDLLPAPSLITDLDKGLPTLCRDTQIYSKDANFPSENIVLSTPTQIRSLEVVLLSITPFRYNPVKKTLEVIYDIDIDIRFEGGNGKFGESRYFNPDWEHILRNLVLNGEMLSTTNYHNLIKSVREKDEEGCEYLIIVPNDMNALAWADTLKAFRTKQGILTKVVSLAECGVTNTTSIRNYILNAYNNWAIPPAAVLLFGGYRDNQGIPPFYHNTIQWEYSSYTYPTDYPYCDMNEDSIADLAISRVTALSPGEYRTFVEKTIQYESNPPTDEAYYDRPIISSGHEDSKWFMMSSQSVNGFYRDRLGKHPTNLYMMVDSWEEPDSLWSTGYNASAIMDYFGPNGLNYIPPHLTDLHDWKNCNDNTPLVSALSQGSFLTLYRDHSNHNRWWCPTFSTDDVNTYSNEPPTYVLSISCSGALFTEYNKCIVDGFCLKPEGGAVGGIGAGSLTYSIFNDILLWGIIDCIWPGFLPDLGSDTQPDFIRPSYVLAEAKQYFAYHAFVPNWYINQEQSCMNLFGCIGETYLNLFTETPQPLRIEHGLFQAAGTNEYNVKAEEGAVICLSRNGEIIDVAQSDGSTHSFILPDMEAGEHFTLTATKQNRLRYEYEITIIPNDVPYVTIGKNGVIIENDLNVLHNGENAHFGIKLQNYGNQTAENITVELTCESPFIEITNSSCQYSNLEPNQTVTIQQAFHFNIDENTPDMTEVDFIIHINDGHGIKEHHFKPLIAAPLIVIKPDITFKDSERNPILQINDEGITDIHVKIANEGHFDSDPVNMQFELLAPFINVESPTRMFNSIGKSSVQNVVFRANAHNSTIDEGWLKTLITLDDGTNKVTLDTLLPYASFSESFDINNFDMHDWQMSIDYPWIITSEEAHTGNKSARSGYISNNQSSSLFITRTSQATSITFYKKVSSESGYDKLHFYIDNVDMGAWSGSIPWSMEKFPVTQGTHTFTWTYEKDHSMDSGSDCAWVDDISFEPNATPVAYSGDTLIACNNEEVNIDCGYAYHYQTLEWTTSGDGQFVDSHMVHPVYLPGPQDEADGGTTLHLNVDGMITPLQLILTDEISLGDSIFGDDIVNPEALFSHYSVAKQTGIQYIWQLEPEEAGLLFPFGNAVDIVWNHSTEIDGATLTVTADTSCSQSLCKNIQFDFFAVDEHPSSPFVLYPNPTDGKVHLIFGQDLQGKSVVEVYDVLGTKITNKVFQNLTKGQIAEINLQHYAPGIYILKLCNTESCWSQKISLK